ncbi:hypothetical protein [Rummeliibacillus suwonensis]|uniref:hypothetical protein n=1 Tax=Rummeliibacillus suwonensis TaxID=1306154 RepID=UPI00289EE861|nr:hypothetical protein [Rummeliibacillus suwonensis]
MRKIIFFIFYPALTGGKTPPQGLGKNEKESGGSTARKSPIGSGQQDVGYSGVATGRGNT